MFNDNSSQMSVKWITLHIKAKRNIYDNLGHKYIISILIVVIIYL